MKCCVSTDVWTWTQEPVLHRFLILAGYLNKLWTDFDEILWVDNCGGLHDLVTSWIRTCIQNCKADSAKSTGRISMRFYEWISCESQKTAFNFGSNTDHIRDAVSVSGFLPRLLTTADLDEIWCRDGAYDREELGKLYRSSRSKVKVKHNKNTY